MFYNYCSRNNKAFKNSAKVVSKKGKAMRNSNNKNNSKAKVAKNYVDLATKDIESKKKKLADLITKLNPVNERAKQKKAISRRGAKKLIKLNRSHDNIISKPSKKK